MMKPVLTTHKIQDALQIGRAVLSVTKPLLKIVRYIKPKNERLEKIDRGINITDNILEGTEKLRVIGGFTKNFVNGKDFMYSPTSQNLSEEFRMEQEERIAMDIVNGIK